MRPTSRRVAASAARGVMLVLLLAGAAHTTAAGDLTRRTVLPAKHLAGEQLLNTQTAGASMLPATAVRFTPAAHDNFLELVRAEEKQLQETKFICAGICIGLAIVAGVVATAAIGTAVTSAVIASNAAKALVQLNTIRDAGDEYAAHECLEFRDLGFKLGMAQIGFNILFQDLKVEDLVDVGAYNKDADLDLGDAPELHSDAHLKLGDRPELTPFVFTVTEADEKALERATQEDIEHAEAVGSCKVISKYGCTMCVSNSKGTFKAGFISGLFRHKCQWCEPVGDNTEEGGCFSHPKKHCKGGESKWKIVRHNQLDRCPRRVAEFQEQAKSGPAAEAAERAVADDPDAMDAKFQAAWKNVVDREQQRDDANMAAFTQAVDEYAAKSRRIQEAREEYAMASKKYQKLKDRKRKAVASNAERQVRLDAHEKAVKGLMQLGGSVKQFNANMQNVITEMNKGACQTTSAYSQLVKASIDQQRTIVRRKRWQLLLDVVAAVFAVLGAVLAAGQTGWLHDFLHVVFEGKFWVELAVDLAPMLSGLNQAFANALNSAAERAGRGESHVPASEASTSLFVQVTSALLSGLKAISHVIDLKVASKILGLVSGVTSLVSSLSHLKRRIQQAYSSKAEYDNRVAQATVNQEMANEELDYRSCGTTLRALEMSKAQEKMLGAFMSINEESTSIESEGRELADTFKQICSSYAQSCLSLLRSDQTLRHAILVHEGGSAFVNRIWRMATEGPITDIAVAADGRDTETYVAMGYKLVPESQRSLGSHQYNLLICRSCSPAKPIKHLDYEGGDSDETYRLGETTTVYVKRADSYREKVVRCVGMRRDAHELWDVEAAGWKSSQAACPGEERIPDPSSDSPPQRNGAMDASHGSSKATESKLAASANAHQCNAVKAMAEKLVGDGSKCHLFTDATPEKLPFPYRHHVRKGNAGKEDVGFFWNSDVTCNPQLGDTTCQYTSKYANDDCTLDSWISQGRNPAKLILVLGSYLLRDKFRGMLEQQHRRFFDSGCDYSVFVPVRFERRRPAQCPTPRLAAPDDEDSFELRELCTEAEAKGVETATVMKVDPELYYLELSMAGIHAGNSIEVEVKSQKDGWSMLPFKLPRLEYNIKNGGDKKVVFTVRVWARTDKRLDEARFVGTGRTPDAMQVLDTSSPGSERRLITQMKDQTCAAVPPSPARLR